MWVYVWSVRVGVREECAGDETHNSATLFNFGDQIKYHKRHFTLILTNDKICVPLGTASMARCMARWRCPKMTALWWVVSPTYPSHPAHPHPPATPTPTPPQDPTPDHNPTPPHPTPPHRRGPSTSLRTTGRSTAWAAARRLFTTSCRQQ